jgi:hypothetical protein
MLAKTHERDSKLLTDLKSNQRLTESKRVDALLIEIMRRRAALGFPGPFKSADVTAPHDFIESDRAAQPSLK